MRTSSEAGIIAQSARLNLTKFQISNISGGKPCSQKRIRSICSSMNLHSIETGLFLVRGINMFDSEDCPVYHTGRVPYFKYVWTSFVTQNSPIDEHGI
eukprot:scaffold40973_cov50-Attheya_sp.AAC.11